MRATNLRTEYLNDAVGIGIANPRFYWNCDSGLMQSAYQIICKIENNIIWDSGKVNSSKMTHIKYQGLKLKSKDKVAWELTLWDEDDIPSASVVSTFEMGLLDEEDWVGTWISGNYKPQKNTRYPVDYFQKTFNLPKKVKAGRLYISAMGLYKASINGERVGEFCLAPGSTDYRKRVQYQTYDVTDLLKQSNTLNLELADGWYRGAINAWGMKNVFGRRTKLISQLEVEYEDGSNEIISSNNSFKWSNDGQLRFADLKDGELFDANKVPTYSGNALEVSENIVPTASDNVIPKKQEEFAAKLIKKDGNKYLLDFSQNIAGFISFKISAKKGSKINIKMGEILDDNGNLTQSNFQTKTPVKEFGKITEIMLISQKSDKIKKEMQVTPKQEINYICSGEHDEYCMEFSVMGFRYALVETEIDLDPTDFTAIAVYSDMEQTGEFNCSNEKVNKLYQNTVWSMKGNFLDVPTDCPTRERLGWTGDAQVFFDTGSYMMNVASFYRKWLRDVADNQTKNGKIAAVVPYSGANMVYDTTGNSVGWADSIVLVPYRFWKRYGDIDLLQECYPMMKKYADYMIKNTGHKSKKQAKLNPYNQFVYEKGFHLGEWLEPEEFKDDIGASSSKKLVHTEECTAYLHYTMKHMAEIAQELGELNDYKLYEDYAHGAAKAYNHMFLSEVPDTDRQAKLIRPLAFNIVENEKHDGVSQRLISAVENRQYRVATGFLSTPFVLSTLTDIGRLDLAYKMLENEQSPGWIYEVNCGATTIWEDWEGKESHNHYSPGSVCQWLFDTMLGIKVSGENQFEISPKPGGTINYATGKYQSIYGEVTCCWKKTQDLTTFEINIPANTTAKIMIEGTEYEVGPGQHKYNIQ